MEINQNDIPALIRIPEEMNTAFIVSSSELEIHQAVEVGRLIGLSLSGMAPAVTNAD